VDQRTHSGAKVGSIMMRLIMRELEKNGISMPDDSREIIFPQGVPVVLSGQDTHQPVKPLSPSEIAAITPPRTAADKAMIARDSEEGEHDDLSSDTDEIREQAAASRDPEQGRNIL